MGDENHNDDGAELARLRARVDKLERHHFESRIRLELGLMFGDPSDVAEFVKAYPEHADLVAKVKADIKRARQRIAAEIAAEEAAEAKLAAA
jgi:hypothetical protein